MKPKPASERRWFKSAPNQAKHEIMRVADFAEDLSALQARGLEPGLSTGWRSVDEFYTVRPREWTLVTGIPGHGKSTWLDAMMINLYQQNGWGWAVFSAENWPLERHAATLMGQYLRKPLSEFSDKEFIQVSTEIHQGFQFLCPNEEDYTVEHILELASSCCQDPKVKGIVIDPWNELDHSRPTAMTETEYISRCLTRIRRFARAHEVHVFLVAHPTKLKKNPTTDQFPVPGPYDVSGSAHFRNKADNCICIWRDVEDLKNETIVYVQKIRFREVGKVGQCKLTYDWRSGRFMDEKKSIYDYTRREPGDDDE